jgi:hypothetical protein
MMNSGFDSRRLDPSRETLFSIMTMTRVTDVRVFLTQAYGHHDDDVDTVWYQSSASATHPNCLLPLKLLISDRSNYILLLLLSSDLT